MRWRVVLLAVGIIAAVLQISSAPKPVELIRIPRFVTDDTPISFQLRILPDDRYRRFTVAAINEVGDAERLSGEDLPGQTTRLIEWDSLSAGDYEITARVYGADDKLLAADAAHVTVLEWRGP